MSTNFRPAVVELDRAIRFFTCRTEGLAFLCEVYELPPIVWLDAHERAVAEIEAALESAAAALARAKAMKVARAA